MSPFSQNRGTHLEAAATHLAHVHLVSVFACSGAICGEDSCTVAIEVPVDQIDGIIQSVCLENNQHRPEDLFSVALHLRLGKHKSENFDWQFSFRMVLNGTRMQIHTVCAHKDIKPTYCDIADDGGTHEVAFLVTLDLDVSAIQEHSSALIHTTLDQTADSFLGLRRDQRAHVCTRLVS